MTESTTPKIESNDLNLEELFKDFYCVPDFQREYVWEIEHVEKLLQDVQDEFYDKDNHLTSDREYFIGSIVACKDPGGVYQLIDGQQRMTTIFLVVCAIRDHLEELGEEPPESLRKIIRDVAADPTTGDDVSKYRLVLQYEDSHNILERIADPGEPRPNGDNATASMRNIMAAYQSIREFLRASFPNDGQELKRFRVAFLQRVKLIRILTPNLAHALKVFETINDRGIGLNAMDLLKNLLFMRTDSRHYPGLKNQWKKLVELLDKAKEKPLRFLRYYVMSQYTIDVHDGLREDQIYDWFAEHAAEVGVDRDPLGVAAHLVECAKAYRGFLKGKSPQGDDIPHLVNIEKLAGGAVRQHLILALGGRHLPSGLFSELIRNVENLFFCYLITREPTKYFERNFAAWAPRLREVKGEEDLKAFIAGYIHKDMSKRVRDVEYAMQELTQGRIQKYRLRYILAKLTQHVQRTAWENQVDDTLDHFLSRHVEIEHILPQKPDPGVREAFDKPDEYHEYVGRLGNLALLEKTINCSVSNGLFGAKLPGYAESGFLLTKSIAQMPQVGNNTALNRAVLGLRTFRTWTSDDIIGRQKILADLAKRVWLADVVGEEVWGQSDVTRAAQNDAEFLTCSCVYPPPEITQHARRRRRGGDTPSVPWTDWDEALSKINNEVLVAFFREELAQGRENHFGHRELFYRVNDHRMFFVGARKNDAYVWQYKRFPDDEQYWKSKIGRHLNPRPVNDGKSLRFHLSSETDFEGFLNAVDGDLTAVKFSDEAGGGDETYGEEET